ncbi:MAG: DMT family transporter [Candidatus Methanoperedens sp.]|nr:DMT family transporter [Candidatus Methanoperedens sp.]MCZ7369777.1 DMT family transporter [Candidatus Methanoperedens sp.]
MANSSFKGYAQVVAASVLFGSIGIFIKLITDMPIPSMIFYRLFFGFAAIILYLYICGNFKELRFKEKKKYLLLLGLFEAGAILTYYYSVRYTDVSMAVLLLYTAPMYVILMSPFILKENITRKSIFALALSITGIIIVIQPGSLIIEGMSSFGIFSGIISGLLYALMILTSRYLRNYYSGTAQATWSIIVSLVVFSPFSMAVSPAVIQGNLYLLILFGLIPTALGGIIYLNGLRLVRAQDASIISLLEPVSAMVFAYIILSEPVSLATMIGGGFILAGAVIISREKQIEAAPK